MENFENMRQFMLKNTCNFSYKKYKIYKRISDYDSNKIFLEFINNTNFGLLEIYNYLMSQNCITEIKKLPFCGVTFKNKITGEITIKLNEVSGLEKYMNLVHELGHAKLFYENKDTEEDYAEVYPIFLELAFLDYIKKTNNKQAVTLENKMIEGIFRFASDANKYYDINSDVEKFLYIAAYKRLRGYLYANMFYKKYLNNKEEALSEMNKFIEKICDHQNKQKYKSL